MSNMWEETMLIMLRVWLNDLGETPTYSDNLLKQLLTTAAFSVQGEVPLTNKYAVDVVNLTITPDPVEAGDDRFTNLVVLKAACITDIGAVRAKAAAQGIKASLGPASIQVSGDMSSSIKTLEAGPCKAYQDAKANRADISGIYKAIIGPNGGDAPMLRDYRPYFPLRHY